MAVVEGAHESEARVVRRRPGAGDPGPHPAARPRTRHARGPARRGPADRAADGALAVRALDSVQRPVPWGGVVPGLPACPRTATHDAGPALWARRLARRDEGAERP